MIGNAINIVEIAIREQKNYQDQPFSSAGAERDKESSKAQASKLKLHERGNCERKRKNAGENTLRNILRNIFLDFLSKSCDGKVRLSENQYE